MNIISGRKQIFQAEQKMIELIDSIAILGKQNFLYLKKYRKKTIGKKAAKYKLL